ncbi:MAG: hypothetical protein AAFM92_09160 [Pseudomonadota bacterium]
MAIDREQAKAGITNKQGQDPELNQALSESKKLELELAKENNSHNRALARDKQGLLGWVFGDVSASSSAALIVILCGLALAAFSFFKVQDLGGLTEANAPEAIDFWERQIERSFALVIAALAYVFGRSSAGE